MTCLVILFVFERGSISSRDSRVRRIIAVMKFIKTFRVSRGLLGISGHESLSEN